MTTTNIVGRSLGQSIQYMSFKVLSDNANAAKDPVVLDQEASRSNNRDSKHTDGICYHYVWPRVYHNSIDAAHKKRV